MTRIEYDGYFDNIAYLEEWINEAPGWFTVRDITSDFQQQTIFTRKFNILADMGRFERHPTKRGCFRRKDSQLEIMDFKSVEAEPVSL